MADNNNTIKTRIQLKSDTKTNWDIAGNQGFVPLLGELIIYRCTTIDGHNYCKIKIGDGQTNVTNLPFIDAGTLNEKEVEIAKYQTEDDFPSIGSQDKLYVDMTSNKLYHYDSNNYIQLSNFTYTPTLANIRTFSYWGPGSMTTASVLDHVLQIRVGLEPQLIQSTTSVVTNIVREGDT